MNYHIFLDEPKELRFGLFFHIEILWDDIELKQPYVPAKSERFWSFRSPTNDELMRSGKSWTQVIRNNQPSEWEEVRRCQRHRNHPVERYRKRASYRRVQGTRLGDSFVYDDSDNKDIIVSRGFAARLNKSGLSGLRTLDVSGQAPGLSDGDLSILQPLGRRCWYPLSVRNAKNACPFCGFEPIWCPDCGECFMWCGACGKNTYIMKELHQGADDQRLVVAPLELRPTPYIDGSKWDGSDFIYESHVSATMLVTWRALTWLLSVHAAPFFAYSVPVDVCRMNAESRKLLDAVMRPI